VREKLLSFRLKVLFRESHGIIYGSLQGAGLREKLPKIIDVTQPLGR